MDFPGVTSGKEPACQYTTHERQGVWSLGQKDPLEEGMAPTPVFLPGESPRTEDSGQLQFMESQRVRHDWSYLVHTQHILPSNFTPKYISKMEKEMATHSSTLAWKIPWMEEPSRLQSMGSQSQTRLNNFTFTFHISKRFEDRLFICQCSLKYYSPWSKGGSNPKAH